ncbi:bifunctional phosphopantothenoylcysteine decarboxylase/phosphopantothenate--cysteine ligase CoaBC [Thermodesulforhabdus norvegica]|uniref:Coenzyme A biosynthesis bifunctional protein CoaBC n=1 Tax=Thermodesulforhabdus norvegica TaxID=39841 RepID=A0A1I4VFZ4_9BACT|nr:bifunctional phosphopantothenoylcysteine decarboxylase/phosphopantothenate--cysteine ligase CoaBC [Thermodesulforhabdus norvegica]SFN00071.1 phosphopantothenoylcysteine decarboxylase / phosphopantothenate--cysteine ligase [Thermodesulforhabdus norvegica]
MPFPVLRGKTVVLGVTGSIAAYKACDLVRKLRDEGCDVHVVMTKNACEFVGPLSFRALTQNPVMIDLFGGLSDDVFGHIELARKADVIVVAPATANILAKAAHGIADDYLSTLLLAARCPVVFCPAMNPAMYAHQTTQANVSTLRERGFSVVEPDPGVVACGEEGPGRLPSVARMLHEIASALTEKSLKCLNVLVTAGPTREFFDPVRFISNPSSGKMGYALARVASLKGAEVCLVSGPTHIEAPPGVSLIPVVSALEMHSAVVERAPRCDVVIMAAAVGDYRPDVQSESKIKKGDKEITIRVVPNPDILAELGRQKREGQVLVGFAAETDDIVENARLKLLKKNLDMIVANDVRDPRSGFAVDTNRVKLIFGSGDVVDLPPMSKDEVALKIFDYVEELVKRREGF